MLCGFVKVVFRGQVMAMRNVRMMCRLFMSAGLMVLGRLLMVRRSMPMMLGCLPMVLGAFVLSHSECLSCHAMILGINVRRETLTRLVVLKAPKIMGRYTNSAFSNFAGFSLCAATAIALIAFLVLSRA